MKKEEIYCDSCKKETGNEFYHLDKTTLRNAMMGDNRVPFDLCEYCFGVVCGKLGIESFQPFPNLTQKSYPPTGGI